MECSRRKELIFWMRNFYPTCEHFVLARKFPFFVKYRLSILRNIQMKVRASIKADKTKGDQIVRRQGRVYVINKKDPNRKQRQKGPARKK